MNVALIDFGSTYTKLCVVDTENQCILGTSKSNTTINTDILEGYTKALSNLEKNIGKIKIDETFACSSAAGGLKIVAIGLVEELTAEAATQAALSAGSKVLKTYSYELNKLEVKEIKELKPDIILLTGGTDGGNKEVVIHNANMIKDIDVKTPIIFAGNKSAIDEVMDILDNHNLYICKNVMAKIGSITTKDVGDTVRKIFLENIIKAKGLTKVEKIIDNIMMPTPSAVLLGATLLSKGTKVSSGIGKLMLIDIGGATTDIHSIGNGMPKEANVIFKGIEEPDEKRTVEGDLGVRFNANSIIDFILSGSTNINHNFTKEELFYYLELVEKNPEILSNDTRFKEFDFLLSAVCVKLAVKRHCGIMEKYHTPTGIMYSQCGKDLRDFTTIIGTGGPIVNSDKSYDILTYGLYEEVEYTSLRPIEANFLVDKEYIISAMGLLSTKYPEIALNIMKTSIC